METLPPNSARDFSNRSAVPSTDARAYSISYDCRADPESYHISNHSCADCSTNSRDNDGGADCKFDRHAYRGANFAADDCIADS